MVLFSDALVMVPVIEPLLLAAIGVRRQTAIKRPMPSLMMKARVPEDGLGKRARNWLRPQTGFPGCRAWSYRAPKGR